MPKKEIDPAVKSRVEALLRAHPDAKPSAIAKMLKTGEDPVAVPTQRISAIKKQLSVVAPKGRKLAAKVRVFKNQKTGKKYEVPAGEPMRHFTLPGDSTSYSLDDFHEMIKKNCGVIKEIDPNNVIREIPMEGLTAADLFLGKTG